MKITDKMRLGWANKNGYCFGRNSDGSWWVDAVRDEHGWSIKHKTLRQAIDAAIRAERRGKRK